MAGRVQAASVGERDDGKAGADDNAERRCRAGDQGRLGLSFRTIYGESPVRAGRLQRRDGRPQNALTAAAARGGGVEKGDGFLGGGKRVRGRVEGNG